MAEVPAVLTDVAFTGSPAAAPAAAMFQRALVRLSLIDIRTCVSVAESV